MQDIRGIQASPYSYAVPPGLARGSNQTDIHFIPDNSYEPGLHLLTKAHDETPFLLISFICLLPHCDP
jgi:hypothetical protein